MKQEQSPFSIQPVWYGPEQILRIDRRAYLFDKTWVSERKQQLCSKEFGSSSRSGGLNYLHYNNTFQIRDKRLSVFASYERKTGPANERVKVSGTYDGQSFGDFSAARGYGGGGAQGKWPKLLGSDWQVAIQLLLDNEKDGCHRFSIEYFESIIPIVQPRIVAVQTFQSIKKEKLSDEILNGNFSLEEISSNRQIAWEIKLDEASGVERKIIRCCYYEDFQQYQQDIYGKLPLSYFLENKPFISMAYGERDCLYVLEIEFQGRIENFYPWQPTKITSYQY